MMETWPELPYEAWKDTCATLHLLTQIVGKVKLKLCPFLFVNPPDQASIEKINQKYNTDVVGPPLPA